MPPNTRGKIKEHLEGVHRNTEGIKSHCNKITELVGDKNMKVTMAVTKLQEVNNILDEFAMNLYGSI